MATLNKSDFVKQNVANHKLTEVIGGDILATAENK
jgi:hypothetical protein